MPSVLTNLKEAITALQTFAAEAADIHAVITHLNEILLADTISEVSLTILRESLLRLFNEYSLLHKGNINLEVQKALHIALLVLADLKLRKFFAAHKVNLMFATHIA